ncbi:DUF3592 domain-containing protein [Gelidibacter salicanalis]|uniref:DUF3592 domain-containing protein n=1 Tax=Gelidibacter salicanalis TaxID=291193 RepID=A0A5C7AKX7_9FLAO|nr:DUF3592 domain-containing protein [Gelidibacter salicanalis]TXE09061.1 DUF3592 domain-containing protein [Gelidibacter salicanalis]
MFTSLTQIQISGILALLVATPFLIKSVRNLYFTTISKQWPKISGTIKEVSDFGVKHRLLYEYTVNRATYKSTNICYTNTNSPKHKNAREFEKRYTLNQIVDVFYNPNKPNQAVLEPGRKDDLVFAILMLSVLFVGGWVAVFQ